MVNWFNLAFSFLYLGILVGSFAAFSSLYNRRKASKSASLAPWFGPHIQRNIYLSLLHIEPEDGNEKAAVPETVLKAALLRRATEDILRIVQIRNSKQALSSLLQRGSVGDDLWQRFLRAEKEIEEELRDVVAEANAFNPNWGQTIFQSANEIANNQMIRQRMSDLQSQTDSEKEWWEKKKEAIHAELMNELDEEDETTSPAPKVASRSSDTSDDTVLVESGGPADKSTASTANKKKKGKK
ncbi:preprotein translocase subunit Sec66 [Venturia nashicola]|uniref:Preprotein translocase subunit Sec66 n=1 Tax=Venturia nashicola TaxID=86259 RepID=A0A4Z1P3U8_9PEZI|nr:preprotein translocase subunit Sec66 [Venturia nashicola]TLD24495.1 preprotein translocase subunit Sec66 [Venturia nashicola]